MLPLKIISLKNQKEFDQVSKSGKKIHGKHFILVLNNTSPRNELFSYPEPRDKKIDNHTPHQSLDNAQAQNTPTIHLGLKVSRKMGNAVKRNKIKRWFREIVRKIAMDNPKYLYKSLILIPKKSISSTTYQELLEDFKLQLK